MKYFLVFPQPYRRPFLARLLATVLLSGMVMSLAACGREVDSDTPASAPASTPAVKTADQATVAQSGITIRGDGIAIDAPAATALLGGYSTEPLSFRIMSGWVDNETIKLANAETDEAEKRKTTMGTFGTLTVQVAAAKAAAGTYQLAPEEGDREAGSVIIDKAKDVGIASAYTSQSGTLTIKSVAMNDTGNVAAVDGAFEGQFKSDEGDSRALSGSFRLSYQN